MLSAYDSGKSNREEQREGRGMTIFFSKLNSSIQIGVKINNFFSNFRYEKMNIIYKPIDHFIN